MTDLSSRVGVLEREVRTWRLVGVLTIISFLVFGVMGAAQKDTPRPIEAQEFVLKKRDGKHNSAKLYINAQGVPTFALYKLGAQDTEVGVVNLTLDGDGHPWLLLQDESSNRIFEVDSKLDHTTRLRLRGRDGSQIELSAGRDGTKISASNGKAETIVHKSP